MGREDALTKDLELEITLPARFLKFKVKMKNEKLQFKIRNYRNIKKELPEIQRDVSLAKHTTFKIGGPAKYFFKAGDKEDLIKAISVAKNYNLPFFILGGGSNLLVSGKGYKGLIVKIQDTGYEIRDTKIIVRAGAALSKLVNLALKNNLTGLEWAAGIPGTLGGAIYGNAGGFGSSMVDIVKNVEVLNAKALKLKTFGNKDCKFGYRDSIFKKNKNLIILSAILKLKKGEKKEIKKKTNGFFDYRKKTQPLKFHCAGSIFKNPVDSFAGELIEKCGLKGKKIGNVDVSEKHANFIVNLGNGKAKDVIELINLIKEKVKKKFKIELKEEIQFLDF